MGVAKFCISSGRTGWGSGASWTCISNVHAQHGAVFLQNSRVRIWRATHNSTHAERQMEGGSLHSKQRDKVIVISGPTAVGKTALALALARKLGGEIVSADSVQVYRGLDVGSAKTPLHERQGVPHHLLDIICPTQEYTAGCFHDNAREATAKVLASGKVPIAVGGTGMYLRWYINGKPGAPKSSQEQVAAVEEEISELVKKGGGWDEALELLADGGDLETALTLERNDWYRLRRALEILRATGRPRTDFPPADLACRELDYDFRCFFLCKPRLQLYRQIDLRCEEMVAEPDGLLHEASWLLDLGVPPNSSCASRAIGYRQAMEYLAGCRAAGGLTTEDQFLEFLSEFQKASRNFAKRQLTWFRSEPLFQWVDASQPVEELVQVMVEEFLGLVPGMAQSQIKAASYNEGKELKRYRAELQVFHDPTARARVMDWIRSTQSGKPASEIKPLTSTAAASCSAPL